jgi:hypothetical protein
MCRPPSAQICLIRDPAVDAIARRTRAQIVVIAAHRNGKEAVRDPHGTGDLFAGGCRLVANRSALGGAEPGSGP